MSTEMIDPVVQPPVGPDTTAERLPGKRLSKWTLYSRRFMRNKASVGGLIVLVLITLIALFGDHLAVLEDVRSPVEFDPDDG